MRMPQATQGATSKPGGRPPGTCMQSTEQLQASYQASADKFLKQGLNVDIIAGVRGNFNGLLEAAKYHTPWPKLYSQIEDPLPDKAVRILAVPLETAPGLAAAGALLLPSGVTPEYPWVM